MMKMIPSAQPCKFIVRSFLNSRCSESGTAIRGVFHPSSFLLHPFLVSAQEPVNVSILGMPQGFVSSAEYDFTIAHHENLTVNQTEFFTFFFEDYFAGFVDHSIFRSQVIEVVHLVRHEDG